MSPPSILEYSGFHRSNTHQACSSLFPLGYTTRCLVLAVPVYVLIRTSYYTPMQSSDMGGKLCGRMVEARKERAPDTILVRPQSICESGSLNTNTSIKCLVASACPSWIDVDSVGHEAQRSDLPRQVDKGRDGTSLLTIIQDLVQPTNPDGKIGWPNHTTHGKPTSTAIV